MFARMLTVVVLLLLHSTLCEEHNNKTLVKRQMVAGGMGYGCMQSPCGPPMGYYTQECNGNKACTDKEKQFCQLGKCIDRLEMNVACTKKDQCQIKSKKLTCQYGRCKPENKGVEGLFCTRHSECKDNVQCCTLVPAVNPHYKVCVPRLKEGQQCGGFGFNNCGGFNFHAHYDPHVAAVDGTEDGCAPCENKDKLKCKEIGLISSLMICKKDE